MRGDDSQQAAMFSDISPEERVPQEHPLRAIRVMVEGVLNALSPQFDLLYAHTGRPSIAPEHLLRALLLQVLYTVRSERLLMEQLDYNLLFRWFVGLNMDDPIWDPSTFSKNRERLREGDVAHTFFEQVLARARERDLSQRKRKRVEEIFGWLKTVGLLRKTRYCGVARVGWMFTFAAAVYNLVRMRTLTIVA